MVYEFTSTVWRWSSRTDSWFFVTLPQDLSDEIDERVGSKARGFGSVPVEVSLGTTTWQTSIFPSKEQAAYVLPLKAAVRDAAGIGEGDEGTFRITVRDLPSSTG